MINKAIIKSGLLLVTIAALSSCSVSADKAFDLVPEPLVQGTITNLPLAGTVQSRYLKLNQGLARLSNGELSLNFVAKEGVDCSSSAPERPYMSALVPNAAGTYSYNTGAFAPEVQRPINFVMNDINNGSGMNVVADTSTIIIEDISDKHITGRLVAKSSMTDFSYDVSGSFQLLNCANDYNKSLKVLQKENFLFVTKYAEVLTLNISGKTVKTLRVMDRVPHTRCNTTSSWYNGEVPIKYIELPIANEVSSFKISLKEMTLGLEGTSSGTSYQDFEGQGEVVLRTRFHTTVALNAKDSIYNNFKVIGRITANNCE